MDPFIQIINCTKKYGNKEALSNINLELTKGKVIGLLGPNGSGKTTLIKLLNGLLKDYTGTVYINGNKPNAYTKSVISYLPDEVYFADWMKIMDAIEAFNSLYDDFNWSKCMAIMERLKLDTNMKIKDCSKGMQEKLQLALVMSRDAEIYILDEPLGGVDPASRDLILDIIFNNYNKEAILLLSTHLVSDIESIFDEVILLKEGELIAHRNVKELKEETGKTIDEYFREVYKC